MLFISELTLKKDISMSNSQATNGGVLQEDDGDILRNLGIVGLIIVVFMLCLGVGLMLLL